MAAGSRTDGGSHQRQPSTQVRKVIQSLREIVGNHSDADIYAVLKESDMDPNETAQKLLNQDPFHEVKRKRDKKKELTGYRGFSDARRHVEYNIQSARPHTTWDRNVRANSNRNMFPGPNRDICVVREYRVKQNANRNVNPDQFQNSASGKEQAKFILSDASSTGVLTDQKQLATSNSEGMLSVTQSFDSLIDHTKSIGPTSTFMSPQLGKIQATVATLNSQVQKEGQDNPKAHSSTSSNSVVGVYSSASDPIHVPSPASRPAGTVGAIRREVGVVGVWKQSSNQPATDSAVPNSSFSVALSAKDTSSSAVPNSSFSVSLLPKDISSSPVPNSSFSVPLSAKDISSSAELSEQSGSQPKCNQINQMVALDPEMSNIPTTRSFSGTQHNMKVHQQSAGYQKAIQCTMEWKPKSSQKPTVVSHIVSAPPGLSCTENVSSSAPEDISNLSNKLSKVNILEERLVIIPQHLQVLESEYTQLTFGSFGAGFDSTKSLPSASQAFDNAEHLSDEPSVSMSASVPVSSSGNTSADDQVDLSACQSRSSQSESPSLAAETEQPPTGNSGSLDHQTVDTYADIGLVQSQSPYSSPQTQQLPTPTSLPSFSAYDPQASYNVSFLKTVEEDSIHGQGLTSSPENLSLHATNSNPSSMVALAQPLQQSMSQQQQSVQHQHQQPVTNMYPQVHFSHFPNFMPYRHVFSPVFVPPMAMPNYSNNPAYPHPSNGSNYILMPGGSSHVAAGGMKFAASQYKQVPAGNTPGYGNYNPSGYTMSAPGSVGGATGLEDVGRIKYKDNNLYVPNPQAETSDMWMQTPREFPSLQTAAYYNVSGQPPHAAAAGATFMPAAHAGHASFNAAAAAAAAAQSSHVHYPALYHPSPSPASLTAAHHLVHQSGHGGSIGAVGVATPAHGPQVGAYPQPPLSPANWPNF